MEDFEVNPAALRPANLFKIHYGNGVPCGLTSAISACYYNSSLRKVLFSVDLNEETRPSKYSKSIAELIKFFSMVATLSPKHKEAVKCVELHAALLEEGLIKKGSEESPRIYIQICQVVKNWMEEKGWHEPASWFSPTVLTSLMCNGDEEMMEDLEIIKPEVFIVPYHKILEDQKDG